MGSIPALSYTIHHSLDRLKKQHEYYEDEILKTRKLIMGDSDADPNLAPSHGIVCATDPTTHTAGGSEPLAVSVNSENQLTLDVNPGLAVMKSGVWIQLHNIVRQVAMTDTTTGIANVIYLQYFLDDAPPEPNYFNESIIPYTVRVGDPLNDGTAVNNESVLVSSLTVDSYTQLAASVKQDIVPLAVVTVQSVETGGAITSELTVDHTDASYAFNRPWFSVVDNFHRSQVGTGQVTPTNPHATSGNDLTVGDLSILQLQVDHGLIVAKDRSIAKVPGYRCTTAVTSILTDASGTLTGYANANYIELPYFPVRVGKVWDASSGDVLAGIQVPQTHRIVFPVDTIAAGTTINVYYTRAEVGEPTLPGNSTFQTNGPTTQELAIAGGVGLVSLSSTEETFADAAKFPMRYEMFMDGDGSLLKTPQVVYCWKKLASIGTSDTTDDITPYGPGRLIVGLTEATDIPTLDVQLRIYGTDTSGTSINELFTFNQANWDQYPAIPSNPDTIFDSIQFSDSTFATITSINIESRIGDGPNTAVMIWMAQNSFSNYDEQADALHIATVDWNGYGFGRVFDKRIVGTTLRDELNTSSSAELRKYIYSILGGGNSTVYVEDFRRPRYHSLETSAELADSLSSQGHHPTFAFSKQQVGLHGYYQSIAFPVNSGSGTTWRISLIGAEKLVDPWFLGKPILLAYESGSWGSYIMSAVPGLENTYEATTAATPDRIRVRLFPGQCAGMALHG